MRVKNVMLLGLGMFSAVMTASCATTATTNEKSVTESNEVNFLMPSPMRDRIEALNEQKIMTTYYEAMGPSKEAALVSAETGARAKLAESYSAKVELLKDKYVGDVNMEASGYMAEAINIVSSCDLSMCKIDDMYTMVSKVKKESNGDVQNGYAVKVIAYLNVDDIMNQAAKAGKDKRTMQQAREMFAKLKQMLLEK